MRYLFFANVAEKEGFTNVARLFKATAFSEQIHASNHFSRLRGLDLDAKVVAGALFGPGNTSKNLELAIRGEKFEVDEMYPAYIAIAAAQGETAAETSFRWALEAEKIHAELYKKAKDSIDRGEDWELEGSVWVCPVCGHTYVGSKPPEKWPNLRCFWRQL